MSHLHKTGTLVIGASTNPARTSHTALHMLQETDQSIMALGLKGGEVAGVTIQTDRETIDPAQVDTITLYLGAKNQPAYYDWILNLKPRRVIFNPGAENPAFAEQLQEAGIEPIMACTLVMIRTGQY